MSNYRARTWNWIIFNIACHWSTEYSLFPLPSILTSSLQIFDASQMINLISHHTHIHVCTYDAHILIFFSKNILFVVVMRLNSSYLTLHLVLWKYMETVKSRQLLLNWYRFKNCFFISKYIKIFVIFYFWY